MHVRRMVVKAIPVGLAITAFLAAAPGPRAARRSSVSRLMVSGREYDLTLSRSSVGRGTALIQFVNRGEDAHDLVLRRAHRGSAVHFPKISSGRITQLQTHLSPGRYRLWCSLSGHARRGMRTTLRVRR